MESSSVPSENVCFHNEIVNTEREILRTSKNSDKNYNTNSFANNTTLTDYANDDKQHSRISNYEGCESSLMHSSQVNFKDYEPYNYGNTDRPTSFWGTVFHLIVVSFGPAILTLPRSFKDVGYITGFIVTLTIVVLYAYNMHILIWSEYKLCKLKCIPNMSYSDTLYYSLKEGPQYAQWIAPYARCTVYVVFVVVWIGCSCFTLVLVSENLQTVFNNIYQKSVNIHTVMIWVIVPLWLLCCIRRLNYLVPFSVAATTMNFICILMIAYYLVMEPWPLHGGNKFGSLTNVPLIAGTVLYNLAAAGIIMPLKNEMKDPRKFNSPCGVLTTSYIPLSFLYAFFGLFCYLKYGNSLQGSVVENLPKDQFVAQLTIFLSILTLIFTYPLLIYVVFDVIWNNILKETQIILKYEKFWEYTVRTGIVCVSFLTAYTAPNISLFLSLSGTVGTSIDSIIFPALMQTSIIWKDTKNKSKFHRIMYKNIFIVIIGVTLIITGITNCIVEFSNLSKM